MTGKWQLNRRALIGGATATTFAATSGISFAAQPVLAPTPPMGWNSWNSFATTITEAQAVENAHIMADKLLPSGYDVFTVDIQWYEPNADGYNYRKDAPLTMDGNGRLLPAPNRFPSSENGKGFKPLSDQVHKMGLKFGVHIMRGIPRQAVAQNVPILGTTVRAQDIANTNSTCTWNGDMYGVDMTKPGAQAYYNSVFKLFADWGVDFVKMDDMSRPYGDNWREIEAAHKAIAASGRPMILSLSPGETDLNWAHHVPKYAQMWRISDDFWDDWKLLRDQFQRLENWNPYRKPGAWPDADMLPLGLLAMGQRKTKFTPDEQQTLMTLWSIARSPLIMGGDLRAMDQATLDLLTNPEVIAVNQKSSNNRVLFKRDGQIGWIADAPKGRYLALFNISDQPKAVSELFKLMGLKNKVKVRDIWARKDLRVMDTALKTELRPHASAFYHLTSA
ncbi:alpha-galactosidase [Asticcacaulis endophyticus]|uniref:Alpha-galactosidase n=2 Tax=Asticcacaulis endophyticus TaxID=1395890 RepID=A0A918QF17_9CAUL|nr:alpha-galactosidase [Asticcacaulis endophyticus]